MSLDDAPATDPRSRRVAALFDTVAHTYDQVAVPWFEPIAEQLVRAVSPQPGERALDVGCGRGAAIWPLSRLVGPAGQVTGVDLSAGMIAQARAAADDRGVTNVDLHVMDAVRPPLPPSSYDLVTASLVLFFLPEPATALTSWVALLRRGGRVGVSTFAGRDPLWVELDAVFDAYLPPQLLDARASGTRGPFASDAGVAGLLAEAGLRDVRTEGFMLDAEFDDAQHWERWSWSHGQRAMWEHVPETDRGAVRDAAFAVLERAPRSSGRLALRQQVRLTVGVRPLDG